MKKTVISVLVVSILLILSKSYAHAAACYEKVTNVTVHSNGGIYFSTDTTCFWCQLNWGYDAKLLDRGYAALLVAKTTGSTVLIDWGSSLSDCDSKNQLYASPAFVQVQ